MRMTKFMLALTLVGTLLVPAIGSAPLEILPPHGEAYPPFRPDANQLQQLNRALETYHQKYDEKEQMLREPFSSPGYHTTLKGGWVHSTRSSLAYAVALLDTGEERWRQRAEAILRRVIALQDQNPESKTYGIWSWFLEEPLDKMSPPDWNWADFCGTSLLQVALHHRHRLAPELARQVDAAIQHAARAIKKRNVGPGYTNIAIMGAYVTLVAGELYQWPEMITYGQARWCAFYEHTKKHGAFNEYNSPTYTVVALEELGRLRLHVRDEATRKTVEEIYRLAWEEMAIHFHSPTRQWAGPHSRCYSTLLRSGTLALIQRGTGGQVDFGADQPALNNIRLPLPCPPELIPYINSFSEPRELRRQFIAGESPVVGTTWLQSEFTLGTINRGDLWNQRRALVAYWGTTQKPTYLHLRFLHDGYDFAAAQFGSIQQKGRVLAGVVLAVDGGDTHVSLDRLKDGKVRAKDLRLRLELGGAAGHRLPPTPETLSSPLQFQAAGLWISLQAGQAVFGSEKPRWESGQTNDTAWLDLVLYAGEEQEFNLNQIKEAAVGLGLELAPQKPSLILITPALAPGRTGLTWANLSLSYLTRPARIRELQPAFKGVIK